MNQTKSPGARMQHARGRLAWIGSLRRSGCRRSRGRSALAWADHREFHVVEFRLRIVGCPQPDFALGDFAVVEIEDHLVVVVAREVSALRSHLEPVPGTF